MTTENSGSHIQEPGAGAHRVDPVGVHDEARTPVRAQPVRHEAYPVHGESRRQQLVSWGAVWGGLVVTLALFLLLEFIFFALGWLDFAQGSQDTTAGLVTAILALVAFFVGGLTAGATSVWREGKGGLLHGILLWALGIVSILFLTLFGGGALFGSLASVLTQATQIQQAVNVPDVQLQEALSTARTGAGWAALGLVLPLVAAVLGGVIGGKIGSGVDDATHDGADRA